MIPSASQRPAPQPQGTAPARRRQPRTGADLLLYGGLLGSTAATWQLSRSGLYTAASDLGYWLGVAGGVMMLLLFAYPLRKRWQAMARLGKAKHWFVVHMVLGIGGPLTVLAHAGFRFGSLNAGVALLSMLVVSASGVVGRFLYLRIHSGLGGERLTLAALREQLASGTPDHPAQLHFAPVVAQRLAEFEQRHAGPALAWRQQARRLLVLPWLAHRLRRQCGRDIDAGLARLGRQAGGLLPRQPAHARNARRLVRRYTASVLRVAQYTAFVRLFSLWHVLHVPFVWLMVACVLAHVVAVHAY